MAVVGVGEEGCMGAGGGGEGSLVVVLGLPGRVGCSLLTCKCGRWAWGPGSDS